MRDLIAAVKKNRADLGIAYDGDADRVGAIDENGRIVWGDELMVAVLARDSERASRRDDHRRRQMLQTDVRRYREPRRPPDDVEDRPLADQEQTERRARRARRRDERAHVLRRPLLRLRRRDLRLVSAPRDREPRGPRTGIVLADLPRSYFTPEIRLDCPDDRKFEVVRRAAEFFRKHYETIDIDGVRVNFADGWGLVRASNTQPALVTRFEANSEARLAEIRALFENKLRELGAI